MHNCIDYINNYHLFVSTHTIWQLSLKKDFKEAFFLYLNYFNWHSTAVAVTPVLNDDATGTADPAPE